MLKPETIRIIQSTVPVLEVYGNAITKRFYERMFAEHPELLNIFNHANQKQGRQQQALANAVYAAAKHIDRLEAILPAVKQIAHKHRSLGVKPEHYPIVGRHLLAAIKEVLGEAATDEIIAAWGEAYGMIAEAFIGVEQKMYEESVHQPGGWEGFRSFRVVKKVKESQPITSFYLVPADGGGPASFLPGQYISVRVQIPGSPYTHIRQYSLSDSPGKPYYRISVKKEEGEGNRPDGQVSVYLHDQIQEGDTLDLSAPAGEFVLEKEGEKPVVLISGGVGLTPMMSMLNSLVESNPGRKVTFLHAARSGEHHAFRQAVLETAAAHPQVSAYWCYSEPTDEDRDSRSFHKDGYVELDWLKAVVPAKEASFYVCGPVPFLQNVYAQLKEWGVADQDLHYEFFGPAASLEAPQNVEV
ncbi:NO-inducible flavohemoprotein [Paenibacillus aurantius]|uniref:Flavohemoprotein n=1 Tax=Paenibacillus aurantius TaxID=2918900 RepID=A0AA96RD48_9BACL|nr:NO-inducible flavohemoprotein [Paenibacillus aurantius]WNQ09026.1 NO-inducible flavohemoprotein [Paenibacillus aurantius]